MPCVYSRPKGSCSKNFSEFLLRLIRVPGHDLLGQFLKVSRVFTPNFKLHLYWVAIDKENVKKKHLLPDDI